MALASFGGAAPPRHNRPGTVGELFPDLDISVQVIQNLDTAQPLDIILFFTTSQADLAASFQTLTTFLKSRGSLWVAWPKKSSKIALDVDENNVRAVGLAAGLVDVKVCAIDETWSGLKFVFRRS